MLLTPRELELFTLIARGYTEREIAGRLAISYYTVKHHSYNVRTKLDVRRNIEAVALLVKYKLINI